MDHSPGPTRVHPAQLGYTYVIGGGKGPQTRTLKFNTVLGMFWASKTEKDFGVA